MTMIIRERLAHGKPREGRGRRDRYDRVEDGDGVGKNENKDPEHCRTRVPGPSFSGQAP